jgi:hypothetical protein
LEKVIEVGHMVRGCWRVYPHLEEVVTLAWVVLHLRDKRFDFECTLYAIPAVVNTTLAGVTLNPVSDSGEVRVLHGVSDLLATKLDEQVMGL